MVKAKPIWSKGEERRKNITLGLYTLVKSKGRPMKLNIATSGVYRVFLNGKFLYSGPARCAHDYYRIDRISIPMGQEVCHIAIEVVNYYVASFCYLRQPGFIQAEIISDGEVLAATGSIGFRTVRLKERVRKVQRYSFQRPFTESYRLTADVYGWQIGCFGSNTESVSMSIVEDKQLVERNLPLYKFPPIYANQHVARGTVKEGRIPKEYRRDRSLVDVRETTDSTLEGYEMDHLTQVLSDEIQEIENVTYLNVAETYEGVSYLSANAFEILSFACEKTGFLFADIQCKTAGRLYFLFDEILSKGDVDPLRLECCNVICLDVEEGQYAFQTMEPYGMRYLKIVALSGEFDITDIGISELVCPQPIIKKYEGKDPELKKVYVAALESFKQNCCDIYMDCPTRERAGWLCDSYFIGKTEHYFTGKNVVETNFLENYLLPKQFRDMPKGMVPMCYPADHLNGEFIPNWAMWLVIELEDYLVRTGDNTFIAQYKGRVYDIVKFFEAYENRDGLLENLPSWVFVEWSMSNQLVRDVSFASNMLYAYMLEKVGVLYQDKDAIYKAENIKETIRRRSYMGTFFCDNEVYQEGKLTLSGDCSETCQYYAFFTGVATPEAYPKLWEILTAEFGPKRMEQGLYPQIHPSNAFIGNYLRMILLNKYGYEKQMLEEIKGYFLYMAECTGTLWEHQDTQASCNHGFASYVAVLIAEGEQNLYQIHTKIK